MTVDTVSFPRMNRNATSGMLIPGGSTGFRASAWSTEASRFSRTK
jgi:hypothetical protein